MNHSINIVIWIMIFNTFDALKKRCIALFSKLLSANGIQCQIRCNAPCFYFPVRATKEIAIKKLLSIEIAVLQKCHKFKACQQIFHFSLFVEVHIMCLRMWIQCINDYDGKYEYVRRFSATPISMCGKWKKIVTINLKPL